MPFGQRLEVGGGGAIVLDEDVVPDFYNAGTVAVDFAHVTWDMLHVTEIRAKIVMDLAAGTAGTGFCHFPEVVFSTAVDEVGGDEARLSQPDLPGFFIGGQVALVVLEVSRIQAAGV